MLSEPAEVGRCGFANSQLSTWQGVGTAVNKPPRGVPRKVGRGGNHPGRLDEVYLPIGFLPIFKHLWENTMRKGLQKYDLYPIMKHFL